MVAIAIMDAVVSLVEPRDPKGGGKGGKSSKSSSSKSSSSKGSSSSSSSGSSSSSKSTGSSSWGSSSSTSSKSGSSSSKSSSSSSSSGSSSSSKSTGYSSSGSKSGSTKGGAIVVVGGGSYYHSYGVLPLWAYILIAVLSFLWTLFWIGFLFHALKERKRSKQTGNRFRWGHVFWGAFKIASFLWIPIGIYRCTCGRGRKNKGNKGATYTKIDDGTNGNGSSGNAWYGSAAVAPPATPYGGGPVAPGTSYEPMGYSGSNNMAPSPSTPAAGVPFNADIPPLSFPAGAPGFAAAVPPPAYPGPAAPDARPAEYKTGGAAMSYYAPATPAPYNYNGPSYMAATVATPASQQQQEQNQPLLQTGPVPTSAPTPLPNPTTAPVTAAPGGNSAAYVPSYAQGTHYYGPGAP